jgi:DNA-binding HxlR family transcriptional regulator
MSNVVALFHLRWSVPVVAELGRSRGSRFVTLARGLGLGRETLSRTLTALVATGVVRRNPGYGHPLRPEYVLTEAGERIAPACLEVVAELRRLRFEEAGLKKWSMPVLLALRDAARPLRFSELQAALPGVTGRALSLALKDLGAAGLVERNVTDAFPPATAYRLRPAAEPLAATLARLGAGGLTPETPPRP